MPPTRGSPGSPGWGTPHGLHPLMKEFDLPCTDCRTALIERTVPAGRLPVPTTYVGEVTIAVRPACEARFYPEAALEELTTDAHQPHTNHA